MKGPFSRLGVVFTEEQKRKINEYFSLQKKKKIHKISIIIFILIVIFSLCLVSDISADSGFKEKDYQEYFAEWIGGETEVMLDDRTRVDILTEVYAIEVDYSYKWAESIGQALFYALKTKSIPGIVLILVKRENHENYIRRVLSVANNYDIMVWTITEDFKITQLDCWVGLFQ